jgi:hypothetical protein
MFTRGDIQTPTMIHVIFVYVYFFTVGAYTDININVLNKSSLFIDAIKEETSKSAL